MDQVDRACRCARNDFKLPPELYADNLKNVGLDIAPDDADRARPSFRTARSATRCSAIAPLIAKEHHLEVDRLSRRDPRAEEGAARHARRSSRRTTTSSRKIEDIIRREHIVTLPERPMIMRIASDAETAAQPAPHMDPPPLIGNKGERGTFVLTLGNPSASRQRGKLRRLQSPVRDVDADRARRPARATSCSSRRWSSAACRLRAACSRSTASTSKAGRFTPKPR